ncbi:MAG: hypothetical protein M1828_000339 [Chrysothrix sp. TS-e1954]|nr:MAG: hypothetical protein M1828_000339 [Chrysothrix sp. TS-e1954]
MAQALSPRASPGKAHLYQHSPSPLSQPQSKRDKRRAMLSEKLADMINNFSTNHHDHFYAQLTALQCDINMILQAQPYNDREPLPDTSTEIKKQADVIIADICRHRPIPEGARKSFDALVGTHYSGFVQDVNSALERRDKGLSMLFNDYQTRLEELRHQHKYRAQLAHEEHALLRKTLRERLIQQLHNKRRNMLKDKEQLDIADSNALLLNSNQFSILNPSSPSGTQNRKTRHTRGRPGETEEAGTQMQDNRRKRKAAFDDNEGGSPGPHSRVPEGGSATPYMDKRSKLAYAQFEAPVYSVEKLFSEKELQMTMNRAHVNSAEFFRQARAQGIENRLHTAVNGAAINGNGQSNGATITTSSANAALNDLADAASASAPQAENTTESTTDEPATAIYHATRSSQRGAGPTGPLNNGSTALADLANAATTLAPYTININTTASKANNAAPPPPPASEAEITSDLGMMQRTTRDDVAYERLVKLACDKQSLIGMPAIKPSANPQSMLEERTQLMGGVPMSKTNSTISRR